LHAVHAVYGGDLAAVGHSLLGLHLAHDQKLVQVITDVPIVEAVFGGPDDGVGGAAEAVGGVAAKGDDLAGRLDGVDHGEHYALWAEVQGFLRPRGGGLRDAEDGGGVGGGERVDAWERVADAAGAVLHVDDDEVVASEGGDLGEGGGEGEEEETVEGVAIA